MYYRNSWADYTTPPPSERHGVERTIGVVEGRGQRGRRKRRKEDVFGFSCELATSRRERSGKKAASGWSPRRRGDRRPRWRPSWLECEVGLVQASGGVRLVEGVGGFCVPFGDSCDAADLAKRLGLPIILVVGLRLGCINHALLTVEAIAARGLTLAGWIANRIDPHMQRWEENLAALHQRIAAPLLGVIPPDSTPEAAATMLHLPWVTATGRHLTGSDKMHVTN